MLKIRPEIVDTFVQQNLDAFAPKVHDHLCTALPEFIASLDDTAARAWVGGAIRDAVSHGFEYEGEIVTFVEISARLGRAFAVLPRNEWAREILDDPELTNPEKLGRLLGSLEAEIDVEPSPAED